MRDSGQDIEFDIEMEVWVSRGRVDRRIAEKGEVVVVVVVVVVVIVIEQ